MKFQQRTPTHKTRNNRKPHSKQITHRAKSFLKKHKKKKTYRKNYLPETKEIKAYK